MNRTVAVRLGADIIYVTGTVNGLETAWQRFQGNVWTAAVPRSESAAYDIRITGWDALGRSSQFETVLRYGFAAVTSRRAGSFYNAGDLNRVGNAARFVADLLAGYGYAAQVQTRTDWTGRDIPTAEEMEVYLGNIRALIGCFCVLPTTPKPPDSMQKLGYEGANAIEQILVDLYLLVQNMTAAWCYCGESYCGEVF